MSTVISSTTVADLKSVVSFLGNGAIGSVATLLVQGYLAQRQIRLHEKKEERERTRKELEQVNNDRDRLKALQERALETIDRKNPPIITVALEELIKWFDRFPKYLQIEGNVLIRRKWTSKKFSRKLINPNDPAFSDELRNDIESLTVYPEEAPRPKRLRFWKK